jgi:hypothetical protein
MKKLLCRFANALWSLREGVWQQVVPRAQQLDDHQKK